MGPLSGLRVVEFEAIGPGPFAGMMLADMGADVILVDRALDAGPGLKRDRRIDVMLRGRRSLTLDLKREDGAEAALRLIEKADALIEGFRPGVMERLGLGPDVALARNPRLVYGRMTGWGQDGPLAPRAGHDINYIALAGVLNAIGRWKDGRESNLLDGGAHFYGTYQCKDGEFISLGSIEPQFYAELRRLAGLDDALYDGQMDGKNWPAMKAKMTQVFKTKTRAEWCAIMEGTDVCFAPVLSLSEAPQHPHMAERKIFVEVDGVVQPAPAPRFSRTPSAIRKAVAAELGAVAKEWGSGR